MVEVCAHKKNTLYSYLPKFSPQEIIWGFLLYRYHCEKTLIFHLWIGNKTIIYVVKPTNLWMICVIGLSNSTLCLVLINQTIRSVIEALSTFISFAVIKTPSKAQINFYFNKIITEACPFQSIYKINFIRFIGFQ